MQKTQAQNNIKETFENAFNEDRFRHFMRNLLNLKNIEEEDGHPYSGQFIATAFQPYISTLKRIGKYSDGDHEIDILIVQLKKETSLERARTAQRNFIARYLNGSRGGKMKDAALVAFVSPNEADWRFSLIQMDYKFIEGGNGKTKVKEEFTPARRWSFLVGPNEHSHTAQAKLAPIIEDEGVITLARLEEAFNIEKVTKEFFEKYRGLFADVKEAMDKIIASNTDIKNDFDDTFVTSVDFSKRLLGQIIFLYFLQKKGWFGVPKDKKWGEGDKNFLRNLFKGGYLKYKNFYNEILEPLFYDALALDRSHLDHWNDHFQCKIPFLNGGLFDNKYNWHETEIELPNDLFSNDYFTKEKDKGDGILDIFDRYNFTVKEDEPLEKEVAVDPEMLGKVFENLLEVKDRKSKGTYYTPREIVHYMCEQSLVNYLATELEGKVSMADLEKLIKIGENVVELEAVSISKEDNPEYGGGYKRLLPDAIKEFAKEIDEKLATIKVCDPAIGSGAFPVGMMNTIVKARIVLSSYIKDKKRTAYNFKRDCIQNSLYGVDIDSGAVEIAKLRLWLSLVVDEDDIKQIKPLPNLDYKIVCGDSLSSVEKNLFNANLFNELEKLKPLFFDETSGSKKKIYKKQIDDIIGELTNSHKDFDFEIYFSEVFHKNGGFDVVIANPPYVTTKYGKINDAQKKIYLKNFETAYDKIDLYVLFFEKAIKISKMQGLITFISPWNFASNFYSFKIRKFLLDNVRIRIFNKLPPNIFDGIIVDNIISVFQKDSNNSGNIILFDDLFDSSKQILVSQDKYKNNDKYIFDFPKGDRAHLILEKMQRDSEPLGKIALNYIGIMTGGQKEMISDKPIFNNSKPVLSGKDVFKWFYIDRGNYVNFDKEKIHSNDNEKVYLSNKKILLRKTGREFTACLDTNKFFTIQSLYNIVVKDNSVQEEYLLALLNSKLFTYIYNQFFITNLEVFPYVKRRNLDQFPIKKILPDKQKSFIDLVENIFKTTETGDYSKNSEKQAKVRDIEYQIDKLVYKLYGLTEDEIKIVEIDKISSLENK